MIIIVWLPIASSKNKVNSYFFFIQFIFQPFSSQVPIAALPVAYRTTPEEQTMGALKDEKTGELQIFIFFF